MNSEIKVIGILRYIVKILRSCMFLSFFLLVKIYFEESASNPLSKRSYMCTCLTLTSFKFYGRFHEAKVHINFIFLEFESTK